ncbi:MFS transporter [Candidatus Thorarchaeota archaeon]|nr:MAG: MFS transporter [Candidatus Thorarchaeota archaeon]
MPSESAAPKKAKLYRNPKVMVLALNAMLVMLGFGLVGPSLSFYLIALEGGLTQPPGPGYTVPNEVVAQYSVIFGVMMAAFMATRTLLARFWGGISDEYGRKPLLLTGLVGYVLLLFAFGAAQNWIHLLLIRAGQGVVSAMVWPVAQAALMDIVGSKARGEGLGLYMMVSSTGYIIGPGLGGFLYNFSRDVLLLPVPHVFRVPYYIAAAIVLPSVFLTFIILDETAPAKNDESGVEVVIDNGPALVQIPAEPIEETEDEMNPKTRRLVNVLYIMAATDGIAMGLGQPLFQLYLMSRITTDIGLLGLIISGAGAIGMFFSIPSGRYADRHGRKGLAVSGAIGARLSLGVLPLTSTIPQTSGVWVAQSAGMAVSQPAMRALQADIVPWHLRGKLFGTIQAFFNAGATLGPLVGGGLFAFFSLTTLQLGPLSIGGVVIPFWIAAVLGIISALLVWFFVDETHPTKIVEADDEAVIDAT